MNNNKKITDFNSFKVFEDIYSEDQRSRTFASRYDELDTPATYAQKSHLGAFMVVLLIIVILSFSAHPLLSYFLKTPYPLIVISEDSMAPILAVDDAVVVRGLIDQASIVVGDYVVFRQATDDGQIFSVRRVEQIGATDLTVKSENSNHVFIVNKSQVLGIVTGHSQPFKIPLLGKVLNLNT